MNKTSIIIRAASGNSMHARVDLRHDALADGKKSAARGWDACLSWASQWIMVTSKASGARLGPRQIRDEKPHDPPYTWRPVRPRSNIFRWQTMVTCRQPFDLKKSRAIYRG